MSQIYAGFMRLFQDHLYRNSMFMVMSRFLNAAAGFLFWVIAAKLYSINEVGTATALISSLGLVMLFSKLGFDVSLIRFIFNTDKNKIFNTSLVITAFASFAISLLFVSFEGLFPSSVALSFKDGIFFILIAFFNSISLISGNIFMALRKSEFFFIQTVLVSLRLFLLFPLAQYKDFGIFLSLGICYFLSVVFSLWALRKEVKFSISAIDIPFLKESFKYSLQSYVSNILTEAPTLILPIMVLHLVGQEESAKYYMAMAIGNLTLIVPNSLSFSLFIEGSHGQPVKKNVIKVCTSAFLSLIPILIIISLWGENILGFISKEYIDAYHLLILVVIASFFTVIYLVYISVQNINMRVERNIGFNLVRFLLLIGISFCLIPRLGILGVGYAWLSTHILLSFAVAAASIKPHIVKTAGRSGTAHRISLTTGPVIRNVAAKRLAVIILNTTCLDHEIKVVVNDVTESRKAYADESLLVKKNCTGSLTLPKPPVLYEVIFENVPSGVFVWTSTSSSVYETHLIESNTFRHKDLISIPNVTEITN